MSDIKKFHLWIKKLTRWQEENESQSDICRLKKSKRRKPSSTKRFYVGKLYPNVYLTQRELEIVVLLMQDQRYKAIASQLSLSVRTIEFYIQNIKLKFHCQNKKRLIAALEKIDIVQKFKLS